MNFAYLIRDCCRCVLGYWTKRFAKQVYTVQDLWFSQHCCGVLGSSDTWRRVNSCQQSVSAFIFKSKQFKKSGLLNLCEDKPTKSFKMSAATHPTVWQHI